MATTAGQVDVGWLQLSARVTDFATRLTPRRDLIVSVVPGGAVAPGSFSPSQAQIVLDGSILVQPGTDLNTINLHDPASRARHAVLTGCLAHETGHADHTHPRGPQPSHIATWSALLEEPRMEAQVVRGDPVTRPWLRSAVAHIIGDAEPATADEAARLLVLIGGRLLGEVLDESTAPDLDSVLAPTLTAEQIAVVSEATAQAVELANGDIIGLTRCAERIATVMDTPRTGPECSMNTSLGHADQDGATPGDGNASANNAHTDPGAGNAHTDPGVGGATGDRTAGELGEALAAIAEGAATEMAAAAGILAPTFAATAQKAAVQHRAAAIAQSAAQAQLTHHHSTARRATPAELAQSRRLNEALSKAAYRGHDKTLVRSTTPPGRTRTSELVRRQSQRATGATVTATPWQRTRRRERPQPALTVAIAADISPSQDNVTDPVAVAAWMLTRAAHDRGGDTATVTWHSTNAVLPATGGGSTIHIPTTDGGSDGLPGALRALDGLLHLTATQNVRVVAIITDAALPNAPEINREVAQLITAGVRVLWLNSNPGSTYAITPPPGVIVADLSDANQLATTISAAAVEALAAAR